MTFMLKGYTGAFVIAAIARCDDVVLALLKDGRAVLDLKNNIVYGASKDIRQVELKGDISSLEDYDVIEINERGVAYVLYAANSNSNALFVTGQCNSNCIMCPNSETLRRTSSIHSLTYLSQLVDYIPSDIPYLTITGGEPFLLLNDFFHLMDKLNTHFEVAQFLLLTNGRALANQMFSQSFCARTTSAWRIGIPLHASEPALHDAISQSSGSYTQTMAGLRNVTNANCEIEIRIVVGRFNYHDLECLAQRIVTDVPRVTRVNIIGLEMLGSAAVNAEQVWIDYRESFPMVKLAINKLIQNGIDVSIYNFPLCAVEPPYWSLCERSISDYKIQYEQACGECSLRSVCGGMFSSTRNFGRFQVRPV